MRDAKMQYENIKPFDWNQIEAGTELIKITARDEGAVGCDYAVKIHALLDNSSKTIYILSEEIGVK